MVQELIAKFELNPTAVGEVVNKFESQVLFTNLPVAEAVEYVRHILQTTINYGRFETGDAPCQAPIDIVVITRDKYFEVGVKPY